MREKSIPPPKNGVQKYYFDLKYNTNLIFFSKNLKLVTNQFANKQ
jgi:hypothetical protein